MEFRSTLSLLSIGISTLMLSSCASKFSESEYPVHIDSVPSKMEIEVTDIEGDIVYRGKTPTVVALDAGDGYFVRARYTVRLYDGSKVVGEREIDNSIDGWYFVNWFGPTLFGFLIVDPITGAMWKLDDAVTVFRDVKTTDTSSSTQQQIDRVEDTSTTQYDGLIAQESDKDSKPASEETK